MVLVHLPVAGKQFRLRPLVGADELLLLEAERLDLQVALALLDRVVDAPSGESAPDAASFAIYDVDAMLLRIRQQAVGDELRTNTLCPAETCGQRVDVTFSIDDYLAHFAPERPSGLIASDDPGWFRFADTSIELRVPSANDQLAIATAPQPAQALLARCVRADVVTAELRDSIEGVLETLAPDLCSDVDGACAECGARVELAFDPLEYTLSELRQRAAYLYADVAMIAHHFHWSESDVLALPVPRRHRYADLAIDSSRRGRG